MQVKVIFAVVKQLLKAVAKKAQKKIWGSNGIETHDLCDTGAMLYQLSYSVWGLVGSGSRGSSIYTCYMKRVGWCAVRIIWYTLHVNHILYMVLCI